MATILFIKNKLICVLVPVMSAIISILFVSCLIQEYNVKKFSVLTKHPIKGHSYV